jgi:predicted enzyme related to lactoylglutathione lyase
MHNIVNWFEIYVQNIQKAKAFYQSVLGIEMIDMIMPDVEDEPEFQMIAFPYEESLPGSSGAIVYAKGLPSGGNSTMVYFSCDDCSLEESRAVSAGGQVLKAKFQIGEFGFCSICSDLDGNAFGLHSMR